MSHHVELCGSANLYKTISVIIHITGVAETVAISINLVDISNIWAIFQVTNKTITISIHKKAYDLRKTYAFCSRALNGIEAKISTVAHSSSSDSRPDTVSRHRCQVVVGIKAILGVGGTGIGKSRSTAGSASRHNII